MTRAGLSPDLQIPLFFLSFRILFCHSEFYFVIPTGAGAPATAERRNLLLPAAPSPAFFAKGGIPSSQPHGLLNKPTTNRDNKPGTHGTFVFVTRPRPRSDQSRFVPRPPDSPIFFVIPNSILSFRPEPERERRRSGGTCCLPGAPSLAFFAKGGIPPRSDHSRFVARSPDSPIFLSFRILFCHSDRSRSASDGGAEEPAVCRVAHLWRSLPRVGFHSSRPMGF